jgi:hypothetical protein
VPVLWKMAALMELCPADVQDMVYQNIDDVHEDYGRLREKIFRWVSNKVAAKGGPTPMDIGRVERHDHETEYYDVDAIGSSMQCYNCSGWGHASRECPSQKTAKGGGKGGGKAGDKGKGKGKGKDWGSFKGYGKGYGGKGVEENQKGKGKGYQGTCFNCGKTGHKAWECRGAKPMEMGAVDEEEEEYEDVEVGTVWNVGAIDIQKATTYKVHAVDEQKKMIEITLDSGAGASCWPAGLLPEVPLKPRQKGVRFRAANGEELKYFGKKDFKFRPLHGKNSCNMEFHVTNATKPLASAMAVVKAGNRVVLSQETGGSYIENVKTKERIGLKGSGGTFVFEVEAINSKMSTKADSQATDFTRQG